MGAGYIMMVILLVICTITTTTTIVVVVADPLPHLLMKEQRQPQQLQQQQQHQYRQQQQQQQHQQQHHQQQHQQQREQDANSFSSSYAFCSKGHKDCLHHLREEHRVVGSALPWENGHEPIEESFAGHFPIRSWKQNGYHGETSMFYWYFPAAKPKTKDPPLVLWLQGGPGSSSMIGLFYENGPLRVNNRLKLERKPHSWSDEYSVLFIDQPVGTGYSYILNDLEQELHQDQTIEQQLFESLSTPTSSAKTFEHKCAASRQNRIKSQASSYLNGYVKDERGVAADLIIFLDQFYQRYPEVQNKDLYLTGESYAGKYIPALAYGIMESNKDRSKDKRNRDSKCKQILFPLKGIALGNSLTDPISQVQVHADHAYYMGLITKKQADKMRSLQDQSVLAAKQGRFLDSNQHRLHVFDLFRNATGGLNMYDIRKGSVPNNWSVMESFMNLPSVKDTLNVFGRAKTLFFKDPLVYGTLLGDIMKSAAWMVSELLQQGIRVLAYQGIFDYRDAVTGSTSWIEHLDWPGHEAFLKEDRKIWLNNGTLAGYVTEVPGLAWVVILGAGHLVPMDQGANSLAMLKSWIDGSSMHSIPLQEGYVVPTIKKIEEQSSFFP
ncbi:Alpha/Beta hydrolase protein [Lobosporangium transversale]|uniref:Carboxypeptidase n=1 Tax=Lobosporangium transversale TaxID=64571 RepID=A0A1Y2GPB9_9FUNG|nr:Alpha/Beta hydrolase protein [Lobosporangium transversale]ORZ17548.1 Alpha/Beta hydrolase protein [Lobosporangium transversale]|eukprot:XP_021881935.1 Alpha/Beta hydrolase protein [Lobosporangium transversale]